MAGPTAQIQFQTWKALLVVTVAAAFLIVQTRAVDSSADPVFVNVDRFLLELSPVEGFDLNEKVSILWSVENVVRVYFENLYRESSETQFLTAGITGLTLVTDEDDPSYETIKFLGGAATFNASSKVIPTEEELQTEVEEALAEDALLPELRVYFPYLENAVYYPVDPVTESPEEVVTSGPITVEDPDIDIPSGVRNDSDDQLNDSVDPGPPDNVVDNNVQKPTPKTESSNDSNAMLFTAAIAFAGSSLFVLLIFLVCHRRRRMKFWREMDNSSSGNEGIESKGSENTAVSEGSADSNSWIPKFWRDVPPASPMNTGTPAGSSDGENSQQGDHETITITSLDRTVESFEHQKRLVDTLKKEMMAGNAELHPYMQDTHMDHTEPCALSPTDLSAAALANRSQYNSLVGGWDTPSDASDCSFDTPARRSPWQLSNSQGQGQSGRSSTSGHYLESFFGQGEGEI